jgi:hypothetical protein
MCICLRMAGTRAGGSRYDASPEELQSSGPSGAGAVARAVSPISTSLSHHLQRGGHVIYTFGYLFDNTSRPRRGCDIATFFNASVVRFSAITKTVRLPACLMLNVCALCY